MTTAWTRIDPYHWRHVTGQYFVDCARAGDGSVYLGWHKPPKVHGAKEDPIAECVSPERRLSFRAAAADCAAHHQQQQAQRRAAA